MAFTALTDTEVASGKSVANTVTAKIKDNFDNHEERIAGLETGTNTVYEPMILRVNGPYSYYTIPFEKVLKTTVNFNLTVTGVRLLIDKAGTAGSTEVDVLFKRGSDPYVSILTTAPSVSYTAGDDALSTNGVVNPTYADLQAGDILAIDINAAQTDGRGFLLRIDFNKTNEEEA